MPLPIIAQIIIGIVLSIASIALSLVLGPKPPKQQPQEFKDLEKPTSGEGRYIPNFVGTVTLKSGHVMDYRNKRIVVQKVSA